MKYIFSDNDAATTQSSTTTTLLATTQGKKAISIYSVNYFINIFINGNFDVFTTFFLNQQMWHVHRTTTICSLDPITAIGLKTAKKDG